MTTMTEEKLIAELHKVWVNLNMKDEQTYQVTCTRKLLGGYGMVRSYSDKRDVSRILRDFGFEDNLVAQRLDELQEVSVGQTKACDLVEVGERGITDDILRANGFIA